MELVTLLNTLAHHYYVLNSPLVSDREYDSLMDELLVLERSYGAHPESPSQRVGGLSPSFDKIKHIEFIGSLKKASQPEDLQKWLNPQGAYVVQPKIDGLTLVLDYRSMGDGRMYLHQALTRGNGVMGEDVTPNAARIVDVPKYIRAPYNRLVVRGEAYISHSDFAKMTGYSSARNAATGFIRRKDVDPRDKRRVRFLAYSSLLPQHNLEDADILSLKQMGFSTPFCKVLKGDSVVAFCVGFDRDLLPYDADGLVVKLRSIQQQRSLGMVSGRPRGAIAWKFPANRVSTILKEVVWTVGMTGVVVPNAVLEPVDVGDAVISKATLNNMAYIESCDLRIGDRVVLVRSGGVIPKILGSLPAARTGTEKSILPPSRCPYCNDPVVERGAQIYCENSQCVAQIAMRLLNFTQRMGMKGLGESSIQSMVEGGVTAPYMLFTLSVDKLASMGISAPAKIRKMIMSKRVAPLHVVIDALSIPLIGKSTAREIAHKVKDLNEFSQLNPNKLDFLGIGPAATNSLSEWLISHRDEVINLAGVVTSKGTKSSGGLLEGKVFVITGTLSESRSKISALIESQGGIVTSSVSSKVDYLVAGEGAGSKLQQAQTKQVPILSEQELRDMIK